jgi:hypothetical protein
MNFILIILLGSNVNDILLNRIEVAEHFLRNINTNTNTNIDWFLSGGIKFGNPKSNPKLVSAVVSEAVTVSELEPEAEAVSMQRLIQKQLSDIKGQSYILDTLSTNTAQNFIRASNYYNQTASKYSDVYIVTSDFHKERASKLMNYIDPTNKFKWILGSAELHDSRSMELVHMRNVYSDYVGGLQTVGQRYERIQIGELYTVEDLK